MPEGKKVIINESKTNQTDLFVGKDKSLGAYNISFMDEQTPIQLSITTYTKTGKYHAPLTWSLIDTLMSED
ncbi:hypothetical protein ACWOC1_05915 [Enterococcus quebecensis]|uniref:WxL domain-containing protein n=1 Tax=Enterococcus quebecensis TaxID=903983 RepID=A0A1E5GV42_9ENTE|nr:hypothetical protein [Enterococcus quebecensis]OEG16497.1 hypothetical protein BCR23_06305 [Enterococcus quebecensis]OJG74129.1 hypothetical protein RV12_GL002767 [Enterococcus quebecensis]